MNDGVTETEKERCRLICRVAWEYRDGSRGGYGLPVYSFEVAEAIAADANKRWPEILFWPEPVSIS